MSDGEGSDDNNSADLGPRPQQKITMLFNTEDFDAQVLKDNENLCAVIVTSTLCSHSGIRKLKYPKVAMPGNSRRNGENEYDGGAIEDDPEEEEEEEEEEEDGRGSEKSSRFFDEMKAKLITTNLHLKERQHVRFFHVCACTVNETNIQPLIAKDPAFTVTNRKPNKVEVEELHRTAYEELEKLVHTLEVRQTPCMLFFVRGMRLRYSLMPMDETPFSTNSASNQRVRCSGEKDWILARGANVVKWKYLLQNAVVVRNEMLRSYDQEVRAKLKEERRQKRKEERLERRRRQQLEEAEESEDEEEYEE